MNFFDRLNAWLDRSEVSWVTLLTKILPILVPIIPAFQTKFHVVTVLGYDEWMGWAAAIVVEFFGYGAMYKMIQFAFKRAGFWTITFTVVIYAMYLAIIVVFNVIPEVEQQKPDYIIWMNALFALLSVPAGALTAISAVHTEREEHEREEKERLRIERREARERRLAEQRTDEQSNTEHRTPNSRTPNSRTPNVRANIPQPANERRTFDPFPNTERTQRIEQAARTLEENLDRKPSVREIRSYLREQDGTNSGWSTSTISKALNKE